VSRILYLNLFLSDKTFANPPISLIGAVHRSEPAGDVAKDPESSADEPRASFAKPARGLAHFPKHGADMAAVAPFLFFNPPNAPAIFNI
jgi:hypothetical protein